MYVVFGTSDNSNKPKIRGIVESLEKAIEIAATVEYNHINDNPYTDQHLILTLKREYNKDIISLEWFKEWCKDQYIPNFWNLEWDFNSAYIEYYSDEI